MTGGGSQGKLGRVLWRVYVPAASLWLVVVVGNWLAARSPRLQTPPPFQNLERPDEPVAGLALLTSVANPTPQHVEGQLAGASNQKIRLLYLGNSQLTEIRDPRPGDLSSPQWLQLLLAQKLRPARQSIEVDGASFGGMNIAEGFIVLVAAEEQSSHPPEVALLSVMLDQFRSVGLREEVQRLADLPAVKDRLGSLVGPNADLAEGCKILNSVISAASKSPANSPGVSRADSVSRKVEKTLERWAERMPVFARREDLLRLFITTLLRWRNRLLGITSTSIRPVPPPAYAASLQFLELCLRYAHSQKVLLVVYLGPVRRRQPGNYLPSELVRLRHDISALCHRCGTTCLDYVDLVPEGSWSNYPENPEGLGGQPDFGHLTGAGHKLLADRLLADLVGRLPR